MPLFSRFLRILAVLVIALHSLFVSISAFPVSAETTLAGTFETSRFLLGSQVFTPVNPQSGEVYTLSFTENNRQTYIYSYTGGTDVTPASIVEGLFAEYEARNTTTNTELVDINCIKDLNPARIICIDNNILLPATITASVTVPVVVVPDILPPVLTLNGSGSLEVPFRGQYTELGATYIDTIDGTGSIESAFSGTVDTFVVGTYTLEYQKVDAAGNTGSITRTVSVIDREAPAEVSLFLGSLTVNSPTYRIAGTTDRDTARIEISYQSGVTMSGSESIPTIVTRTLTGFTVYDKETFRFADLVPLVLNASRAFTIRAIDASNNSNTGVVVVLTNSNILDTSRAAIVIDKENPLNELVVTTGTGGITSATRVTLQTPVEFRSFFWENASLGRAILPSGTEITTSVGTPFNVNNLTLFIGKTPRWLPTTDTSKWVLEFTLQESDTGLRFSKPVKVEIPLTPVYQEVIPVVEMNPCTLNPTRIGCPGTIVLPIPAFPIVIRGAIDMPRIETEAFAADFVKRIPLLYTGSTILVKVRHGGTTEYVTTGLTNNPNSICTNGVSSAPSNVAPVTTIQSEDGQLQFATIYTCAASTFVALTSTQTQVVSSGGGGGGGGSYAGTARSNTGTTSTSATWTIASVTANGTTVTPIVAGGSQAEYTLAFIASRLSASRGFYVQVIPRLKTSFAKSTVIVVPTTLPNGTRVQIAPVTKRGTTVRIGAPITVVVRNEKVTFRTKTPSLFRVIKI